MVTRALSAFAMLIASSAAAVGDYCISCVEPNATYRCLPEDRLAQFKMGDENLGRLCAKILARLEKHTRCEFSRDTAKPCDGIERIVSLTDVERAVASSGEQPTPSLVEKAAIAVSNAGQVAKEQVSKTGSSIQNAWHCLTSLFKESGK
jgi:hypothetical protein